MQPVNALICRIRLDTGLRIDDVCCITVEQLRHAQNHSGWLTITEQKTGKRKSIRIKKKYIDVMAYLSGTKYVFENRDSKEKHRTRQRVWYDLRKAARGSAGLDGLNIAPHSLRKAYAVDKWRKSYDLEKVQKSLNHDNAGTTLIYITSPELTKAGQKKRKADKNK